MKNLSDQLLKETFEENGYASFRDQVYQESLGTFRRRMRTKRWINLSIAVGACCLALVSLLAISRQRRTSERNSSLFVIASQPLLESQKISSMSGSFEVISRKKEAIELVQVKFPLDLIRTSPAEYSVRWLSDNELMAEFQGHAIALGSVGPNEKRLLFSGFR